MSDTNNPNTPAAVTRWIEVLKIRPPEWNSRVDLSSEAAQQELKELAASMVTAKGEPHQLQPITVETLPDGDYLLVYGSRRVAAAKINGWTSIHAEVRPLTSRLQRIVDNGIENLKRRNLSNYEEGRLCAQLRAEGVKTAAIGPMIGISPQKASNLGVTYEKLAPVLREEWQQGAPAATVDYLRGLVKYKPEEQISRFNARTELLRVAEDVLENEAEPQGDEDEDEDADQAAHEDKGRTSKETGGAPMPPYRVAWDRFQTLIRALNKEKPAGSVLAAHCARYLVGLQEGIPTVIEAPPDPELVKVETPKKKPRKPTRSSKRGRRNS